MQLLPGEDPSASDSATASPGKWSQIAGVVEDGKYRSLGESPSPTVFQDMEQNWRSNTTLVARSPLVEAETTRLLRRAVGELDPSLTIYESGSLTSQLALALFPARWSRSCWLVRPARRIARRDWRLWNHGLCVSSRTREIGIRMALGAASRTSAASCAEADLSSGR